jgi:hypothetical protein
LIVRNSIVGFAPSDSIVLARSDVPVTIVTASGIAAFPSGYAALRRGLVPVRIVTGVVAFERAARRCRRPSPYRVQRCSRGSVPARRGCSGARDGSRTYRRASPHVAHVSASANKPPHARLIRPDAAPAPSVTSCGSRVPAPSPGRSGVGGVHLVDSAAIPCPPRMLRVPVNRSRRGSRCARPAVRIMRG